MANYHKRRITVKKKISDQYSLEEIEKILKPKLSAYICYGLIYIGPYLHLFRIIIEKSYDDLLKVVIATGITLPLFTLNWIWYIDKLKHYKIDAKEIYDEISASKEQ
jgi:hypothetical protein